MLIAGGLRPSLAVGDLRQIQDQEMEDNKEYVTSGAGAPETDEQLSSVVSNLRDKVGKVQIAYIV